MYQIFDVCVEKLSAADHVLANSDRDIVWNSASSCYLKKDQHKPIVAVGVSNAAKLGTICIASVPVEHTQYAVNRRELANTTKCEGRRLCENTRQQELRLGKGGHISSTSWNITASGLQCTMKEGDVVLSFTALYYGVLGQELVTA